MTIAKKLSANIMTRSTMIAAAADTWNSVCASVAYLKIINGITV